MQSILEKLEDPSWWFTGFFFVVVGLVLAAIVSSLPGWLRKWSRASKAKQLQKVKSIRHRKWDVYYQIAVERTYFIIFALVCLGYVYLMVASPLVLLFKESVVAGFIVTIPIYWAEVIWLKRNSFVKQLIKYANKVA